MTLLIGLLIVFYLLFCWLFIFKKNDRQLSSPRRQYVQYGDPNKLPFWGDPDDWGFDRKMSIWMYYGDDEQLQDRYWKELDVWMGQEFDDDGNCID